MVYYPTFRPAIHLSGVRFYALLTRPPLTRAQREHTKKPLMFASRTTLITTNYSPMMGANLWLLVWAQSALFVVLRVLVLCTGPLDLHA